MKRLRRRKPMKQVVLTLFALLLIFGTVHGAAENPNYKAGVTFYKQKKFLQSIGSFKKAIQEGYHDPNVYFYLGNAYLLLNNNEIENAIDNYLIAYEFSSSASFQATVLYQTGYAYYLKKDFTNSIVYFNKSFEMNKTLHQTFWAKGMAYYRLRDKESVIREWESYIMAAPQGLQSDNIKKALAILKDPNFQFPPEGAKDPILNPSDGSTNQSGVITTDLPDITGVLGDVKPEDKGKAEDSQMEDIEM